MKPAVEVDAATLDRFAVPAMNTVFSFRFDLALPEARKVAGEAERMLGELELRWSRFIPESEISQINGLPPGEALFLSDWTRRCLVEAIQANLATDGLFDACLPGPPGPPANPAPAFSLDADRSRIIRQRAGPVFDLGGIAKGFALDLIAAHCADLGAGDCFLSAGDSTHLATGRVQAGMAGVPSLREVLPPLRAGALATSGIGVQGGHICDPATGLPPARYRHARVTVFAPTAAQADAYSTACMLMTAAEVEEFARAQEGRVLIYRGEPAEE